MFFLFAFLDPIFVLFLNPIFSLFFPISEHLIPAPYLFLSYLFPCFPIVFPIFSFF